MDVRKGDGMAGCRWLLPVDSAPAILVITLLVLLLIPANCDILQLDKDRCEFVVRSWGEKELNVPRIPQKLRLRDLLFFLHIPRTGGRTYHQCFLKQLFGSSERCPRSYDMLRFDTSRPGCRLVSTHDDYSILQKLPHGKASVVTNLRDPVSRVLSSYEFSVEVAARFLRHYKFRTELGQPGSVKATSKQMSTLDIWPWKYLVPFMQKDVFARRDAREVGQRKAQMNVTPHNSYDVDYLVMPLHEFINHPIAHELVHNGATFQVAGITNNSYVRDAKEIRSCSVTYEHLGAMVLKVAKRRLDDMLYVGLTEHQQESVTSLTEILRDQLLPTVISSNQKGKSRVLLNDSLSSERKSGVGTHSVRISQASVLNSTAETSVVDTIDEVLASYEGCVKDLRDTQENRRTLSLELISPITFNRKERKLIPEGVIDRLVELNRLDAELFSHAQHIFADQQKRRVGVLHTSFTKQIVDDLQEEEISETWNLSQHQSPNLSQEQALGLFVSCIAASVFSLMGLISVINYFRRKHRRERTSFRVLPPFLGKVHEKV